jgi:glycosyltransferase involved in cell wall biosynthesis
MPVRNGARFITEAITSLLSQDFPNFRLLISDNASEDETEEICRGFALVDSRVTYQRLNSPVPALNNFLNVLEASDSRFFMWAAHDDTWETNWLSTLVPKMSENHIVGAMGRLEQTDCNGGAIVEHPAHGALLRIAESRNYWWRTIRFVSAPESRGKANLIYSVFRSNELKITMRNAIANSLDFDCAIVLGVLEYGAINVDSSAVFRKRICQGEQEPAHLVSNHSRTGSPFISARRIQTLALSWRTSEFYKSLLQYQVRGPAPLRYAVRALAPSRGSNISARALYEASDDVSLRITDRVVNRILK